MPRKPQITATRVVATSRLFQVEQLDLRFANGQEACYERLKSTGHGAVLIVAMRDADTVLLVREYAAGVDRYELACPKGRIDAGESPEDAANRELMEEVGCGARRIQRLKALTLAPGSVGHLTQVLLAQDLYPERRTGDEPEPIEVVPWRLDDLAGLLRRDECTEARSIAALYMAREHLQQRG